VWRGELHLLLDRLRFLDTQTRAVEARLDVPDRIVVAFFTEFRM
jgi:hypothetical protein